MKTPIEVLAELFDSDDHHPFSHPTAAAKRAIKRLDDAGYIIVTKTRDLEQKGNDQ